MTSLDIRVHSAMPKKPKPKRLATVAEIAVFYGVCEKTVYRWVESKKISPRRVHRMGVTIRIEMP